MHLECAAAAHSLLNTVGLHGSDVVDMHNPASSFDTHSGSAGPSSSTAPSGSTNSFGSPHPINVANTFIKAALAEITATFKPNQINVFPHFHDADVTIISPRGRVWKLHALILGKASPVLNKVFEDYSPAKLKRKDVQDGKLIRWKLIMLDEPLAKNIDRNGNIFKKFKAVEINYSFPPIMANSNGLGETAVFESVYDNFFRCLYNLEPKFKNDVSNNQAGYICDATTLLQASTYLDARPVVRNIVEAHLLRLNQLLWYLIAERPEGWASLACRIQSPVMFREAMIHIVGRFALNNGGINKDLLGKVEYGEEIFRLSYKKAKELKNKKLCIERRLSEFFPDKMTHKEDNVGMTIAGRAIYASDIYFWQALTLVRQYFFSAYQSNMHHRAPDGGLNFYRTILSGDTYLRADTLERFHKIFDMSAKGRACLISALEDIKKEFKPIVEPLLIDRSQATRSPNDNPPPHLTCTEILDEELPWYEAPVAGQTECERMDIDRSEGSGGAGI